MTNSQSANKDPSPSFELSKADDAADIFAALLDTADTGLIALAPDGTICHWNQWMQNRSGKKREQVLGKKLQQVFPGTKLGRVNLAIEDCPSIWHACRDLPLA